MHEKNNKMTKLTVLMCALMLVVGCTLGGTLAWLIAETPAVENTFTVGNITLTLEESWNTDGTDDDEDFDSWTGKIVPGTTLKKDPVVTVAAGSEDCWVFVKVEESNIDNYVTYEVLESNSEWTDVTPAGVDYKLYAREYTTSTSPQNYYVLKDIATPTVADDFDYGCVQIPSTVTKTAIDALGTNSPKLTFTAYAIQKEGLKTAIGTDVTTAAQAWEVYCN